MKKINQSFYQSNNVLELSKTLLGKVVVTKTNNQITSGKIVEVEAYLGAEDKASHSYNNKKTNRTQPMFDMGGIAYVYLCYGIHHLFNIVVGDADNPYAILIRSIEPIDGIDIMLKRRKFNLLKKQLTNGPGKLTKALGITTSLNAMSLTGDKIWIENHDIKVAKKDILSSPRIGVDYAGWDAKLPYRFYINNNKWVSNA